MLCRRHGFGHGTLCYLLVGSGRLGERRDWWGGSKDWELGIVSVVVLLVLTEVESPTRVRPIFSVDLFMKNLMIWSVFLPAVVVFDAVLELSPTAAIPKVQLTSLYSQENARVS